MIGLMSSVFTHFVKSLTRARCCVERSEASEHVADHWRHHRAISRSLVFLVVVSHSGVASAQPSFPGAEGFGATTPGGRGGPVVKVTTVADSGPGSLRWALETLSGPRIVVFDVGGEISLSDQVSVNGSVTVAGQTAPGAGVTITGARLHIVGDDVIIRGLRVRPGAGPGQPLDQRDGISVGVADRVVRRVIIDRNSVTWAVDENMATWYQVEDVTFSNNIVAEALNDAGHSKGRHSMGMLIGDRSRRISVIKNLLVSNQWRNPQIKNSLDSEVINNFIFNFGLNGLSIPLGPTRIDIINNVYEAGADTPSPTTRAAITLLPDAEENQYYVSGNMTPMGIDVVRGTGSIRQVNSRITESTVLSPLPTEAVKNYVLANAGARVPDLDAIDARIVSGAAAGWGAIVDSPPRVPFFSRPRFATVPERHDSDGDGLPDTIESTFGTNPTVIDSQLIDETTGYSFIELYVNGLFE